MTLRIEIVSVAQFILTILVQLQPSSCTALPLCDYFNQLSCWKMDSTIVGRWLELPNKRNSRILFMTKFGYKLSCSIKLQIYLNFFFWLTIGLYFLFIFFMLTDEAVNLTSEKHDPCAQKSPTQKKKTRIPCRRHRCGAGQIPSEG